MHALDFAGRYDQAVQRDVLEDALVAEERDVLQRAVQQGDIVLGLTQSVGDFLQNDNKNAHKYRRTIACPGTLTHRQTVNVSAAAQRVRHITAALQIPAGRDVRTLPLGRTAIGRIGHANRQRSSIGFPFARISLHVQLAGVLSAGRMCGRGGGGVGRRLVDTGGCIRRSNSLRCRWPSRTVGNVHADTPIRCGRGRQQRWTGRDRVGVADNQQQQQPKRFACD